MLHVIDSAAVSRFVGVGGAEEVPLVTRDHLRARRWGADLVPDEVGNDLRVYADEDLLDRRQLKGPISTVPRSLHLLIVTVLFAIRIVCVPSSITWSFPITSCDYL